MPFTLDLDAGKILPCLSTFLARKQYSCKRHAQNALFFVVGITEAIFKTRNGESGNGNGEWEWGMGTGNGNGEWESVGNDRGICAE